MFRKKKPGTEHHRYIFVDKFEKDEGFRDYLAGMARLAMRNAGIMGIALPLIHFGMVGLPSGKKISLFYSPGGEEYFILDKLVILFLGMMGLFLSKKILQPQFARVIISFIFLVVSLGIIFDDVSRGDVSLTVGYLVLVMLVAVGTVPFRPWQVFLLGFGIVALFYFSIRFIPPMFGEESLSPDLNQFALLTMVTLVCTSITIIIYLSRYIMYRSRQKETTLRQAIAQKAEELEELNLNLRQTQAQLIQSEKMAALGNLIAGVAHEINTPMGAVNSMFDTIYRAIEKLKGYLGSDALDSHKEKENIDRIFKAIEDSKEVIQSGSDRVINIVSRLRSFIHLDEAELKKVDIHEGIEDTLVLVQHEMKNNINVVRNFGEIPLFSCYPRQLNQVFLNVLLNGIQAIEDEGTITITTGQKSNKVYISFADDGIGIPEENIDKVFDPGFTTKGVGVGTGMGLSICFRIIENHGGEIDLKSEPGKGSNFTIVLPMDFTIRTDT
jgi:signal transduction histidine kinase